MTIFLALSALVNITLGYGLAIYLGHARLPLGRRRAEEPLVDSYSEPIPQEFEAPAPAPAVHSAPTPTPAQIAAAIPPTLSTPGANPVEATTDPAELENDVLAGIEEFRNQLAQMKAQPEGADAAAPQTAHAALAGV